MTGQGKRYILHLIEYFSSFSIAFATSDATVESVLPCLNQIISVFPSIERRYVDPGQHFRNWKMDYLMHSCGIAIEFRPTGASLSTEKIENAGWPMQDVLVKMTPELHNWDLYLRPAMKQVNKRVLKTEPFSPLEILFGLAGDDTLPFIPGYRHRHHIFQSAESATKPDCDVSALMLYRSLVRETSRGV